MLPWEKIATATAPDGALLELRRRGREYLIRAGGLELMSSEDERSSRALSELGCAHMDRTKRGRVLVGGLGMGFTLSEALAQTGPTCTVEVAELVQAVADWNREWMGHLAGNPLDEPRSELCVQDVRERIRASRGGYDAILLDVDNGPDFLAHPANDALYDARGLGESWSALRPGGVLGVWSFSDDKGFTRRLEKRGYETVVHKVPASRKGRGRYHWVWIARRPLR